MATEAVRAKRGKRLPEFPPESPDEAPAQRQERIPCPTCGKRVRGKKGLAAHYQGMPECNPVEIQKALAFEYAGPHTFTWLEPVRRRPAAFLVAIAVAVLFSLQLPPEFRYSGAPLAAVAAFSLVWLASIGGLVSEVVVIRQQSDETVWDWQWWDRRKVLKTVDGETVRIIPASAWRRVGRRQVPFIDATDTANPIPCDPYSVPLPEVSDGDFAAKIEHSDSITVQWAASRITGEQIIKYGGMIALAAIAWFVDYMLFQSLAEFTAGVANAGR